MKRRVALHEDMTAPGTGRMRAWGLALGVFLLALLPRVLHLAVIITPDERRWVERSVKFLGSLLLGDLAGTFQTGHPGVTTMWMGAGGLWAKHILQQEHVTLLDYLGQVTTRPSVTPEFLLPARLPTAILTALAVGLVYLLLRRLFNNTAALLGAVILALDPFYLAHSRVIHHDALATTFSVIALIGFLGYVWRCQGVLWLIGSGIAAGLALLSKGSALFLLPFVGLVLLWAFWADLRSLPGSWRAAAVGRIGVGLFWLGIVALVFVAVWPAMWVQPIDTFVGMFDKAVGYAQEAHSKGNYFLGRPVEDPGFLFYPLVILFRTTPLSLLGLALFVVQLVLYARRFGVCALFENRGGQVQTALLAYVLLFTLFMGFGSKKFDRYLLSVFPVIDILSGIAIAQAGRWLTGREELRSTATALITGAVLLMQGLASLPQHPYYLSAYNALAGGPWLAQKVLLVGWGEGLEEAAAYLNRKPRAAALEVSLFYYNDFQTFFKGAGTKLVDDNPYNPVPWAGSDYVVFYINQVQRQIPDEATVDFFASLPAEFRFERNGIPYVQVYRTPDHIPAELLPGTAVAGRASWDGLELLSYHVAAAEAGSHLVELDLYWRARTSLQADYQAELQLVDDGGRVVESGGGRLYSEGQSTAAWPPGKVVYTPFRLPLAQDLAPGEYLVRVASVLPVTDEGLSDGAAAEPVVLGPFHVE